MKQPSSAAHSTDREHIVPHDATLMSITDIHSYITYSNDSFAEISGFSPAELLNQPHNILRHPDMPKQVFADMWATLKRGESWSGLIKNRRKDGGYYWVKSNAIPVVRNHVTVGYMSIRTRADSAEILRAQHSYAQIRAGSPNYTIERGTVFFRRFPHRLGALKSLPIRWRIRGVLIGLLLIQMLMIAVWGPSLLGAMAAFACSAALFTWASLWLETQIATPLEQLRLQALTIATGNKPHVEPMQRTDEIGITYGAINQLGLMFRWLVNDVSTQLHSPVKDEQTRPHPATFFSHCDNRTDGSQPCQAENKSDHSLTRNYNADPHYDMQQTLDNIAQTLEQISLSTKQIDDISLLIDNIVFQANILALNTAAVAPRDKDAGPMVGEVRRLALQNPTRSQPRAAPITGDIRIKTDHSPPGEQKDVSKTMLDIVNRINMITKLMAKISSATSEQNTSLQALSSAMEKLENIKRDNALLLEKDARLSATLNQQQARLKQAIAAFSDSAQTVTPRTEK